VTSKKLESRAAKPPRLFNFKEWLTLEDAARHLSLLFDEEVSVADVLRLALDKRLVLSVWFVNHTYARKGRLVPLSECKMRLLLSLEGITKKIPLPDERVVSQAELVTIYPTIQEHIETGYIVVTPDAIHYADDQWLIQDEAVVSIDGIWDLPMVGGEALDVEHRYQMETGGPSVTLSNLEGAFVERDNAVCQLQDNFDDNEYVAGSTISGEHLERRILEENLPKERAEELRAHYKTQRHQLKEQWKRTPLSRYYPAAGLPADAVYVVRTASLRAFEQSALDNPSSSTDKPFGRREETTLLNIVGGLLGLLLGQSPAGKPHSVFKSQTAIIDALVATYPGKPGISKRTLEEKLALARRFLDT
jgi:hypothetical protein